MPSGYVQLTEVVDKITDSGISASNKMTDKDIETIERQVQHAGHAECARSRELLSTVMDKKFLFLLPFVCTKMKHF